MQKSAQKKELDPRDKNLRLQKKNFNSICSGIIDDLINFKRLLNGAENSFVKQPGKIHEPIKGDPTAILGMITSDFQELAQKAHEIVGAQLEYSKARRKKQIKLPPSVIPNDLAQQLASSIEEYQLIAEASNPITRTLSRLKGPWFGNSPEARVRKYRLAMLRTAALLEEELKSFEVEVLGASSESIFKASKFFQQASQRLSYLFDTFNAMTISIQPGKELSDNKEETKTPAINMHKNIADANNYINDFQKNEKNFLDLERPLVIQFGEAVQEYMSVDDNDLINKSLVAEKVIEKYQAIISNLNSKRKTDGSSLENILLFKRKEASVQMEIIAQKALKKWVGKVHHKINPFNETSPMRLEISKISEDTRELTDQLMEILEEKEVNQEMISSLLKQMMEKFSTIKILMRPLEGTIKNKMFGKTFVNMLGNKDLPYYGSNNMDPKQRHQFEQSLLRRDLRDLTNSYDVK